MLYKKIIRDIKNNKAQFISIFIMAFLGVCFFTGITSEYVGIEECADKYYETTNLADGVIYQTQFSNEDIDKIANLSSTKAHENQLVIKTVGEFSGDPEITLHFVEKNELSKFFLVKGEKLDINDKDGIWLDKRFADIRGLDVGDKINLMYNGLKLEKEIKGIGYSPEYIYTTSDNGISPEFSQYSYGYLSYKAFPQDIVYNKILVKFTGDPDTYGNQVKDILNNDFTRFVNQSEFESVKLINSEIEEHKMMSIIFPIIFVLVSFLTLITTMIRIVNNQRTQIGTLKSLGFKDKTIILHYVSYGFWLILIGAILGLLIGPKTLPYMFYKSMSKVFTMPYWAPGFDISFIILTAIIVIVATGVTYLAVRNISKESPALAIRPKTMSVKKSEFIEKTKLWKKLGFNARWNFRDANRNKLRSIMTIVGVIGCTTLLLSAFATNDVMNLTKEWKYEEINKYSTELTIESNTTNSTINSIASEVNGDKIMKGLVEIDVDDVKKTGTLLVYNETDLISPTNLDRNPIEIPSEGVSISSKMASLLNIKKGDTIKWHVEGVDKWVKTNITQIHSDPSSQGLIMKESYFESLGYNYTPTSIVTSEHVDKNFTGIKSVNSMEKLMESWDDLKETMDIMVFSLISFACFLSIVVLYNLGMLSFTEIKREIATLKVLGFKTKDLRKLLLTQNLWFTTIGFIIGVPTGILLTKIMMSTSGESFQYPFVITPLGVILTFIITFGISILVNLLFSRKIKNINMVESLKNVE